MTSALATDAGSSETPLPQQYTANTNYTVCLTPVPKEKGDAGIYAALDAMHISRALHGVTESRLEQQQQQQSGAASFLQQPPSAVTAAGGGVAGARANGAGARTVNSANSALQLGVEPAFYRHGAAPEIQTMFSGAVVAAVSAERSGLVSVSHEGNEPAGYTSAATATAVARGMEAVCGTSSTVVGLPADVHALDALLPFVHELKPQDPLNYDALQRLVALLESAAAAAPLFPSSIAAVADASPHVQTLAGITTLVLSNGTVNPSRQPDASSAAWEAVYADLQARYPLPIRDTAHETGDNTDGDEEDDDDDADLKENSEDEAAAQHNAALQERCATLQIPYTTYTQALRDLATYETRVFPLLCAVLSHNETCLDRFEGEAAAASAASVDHCVRRHRACDTVKVLDLSNNALGGVTAATAAARTNEADSGDDGPQVRRLAPLRALAALIDSNESLRYLSLRCNALGPRGVGIVAKALTKNVALVGVDLSANGLGEGADDVEEVEDPINEEEDFVFGETTEGLTALAEVLKKNKFLRVLRLAENSLHAGGDLTGPPPPEEEEVPEDYVVDCGAAVEKTGRMKNSGAAATAASRAMTMTEAQERWQGIPLWTFLSPLHRYHRLRVLDLANNFLGNAGAQMVAVALAQNPTIEVLDLTNNAIGYTGLLHLSRSLLLGGGAGKETAHATHAPSSPQPQARPRSALHTLMLRRNPLTSVGGAADAASGVDARRRRLTKRQLKRATAAIQIFADALQQHGQLRRLIVSDTYLGSAASAVVLRAVARVPTLEELDFSFNNACGDHAATYDPVAIPHIAELLSGAALTYEEGSGGGSSALLPSSAPRLWRLGLDGNNLTAAGLAAALSFPSSEAAATVSEPLRPLTISPALHELTLSRNSLGDALGPLSCLLSGAGITRLDLSYNDITTLQALVNDFSTSIVPVPDSCLTELNVSHNKLGAQEGLLRDITPPEQEYEVTRTFQFLMNLPRLEALDISYNDWRRAHVEALSQVLADTAPSSQQPAHQQATGLRKLDIRHTPRVSAEALMHLFQQVVAQRPSLEVFLASVSVEKAEETEGGAWTNATVVQAIHEAVAASHTLVEVDVGLRAVELAADGGDAALAQVAEIRERLLLNALVAAVQHEAA